MKEKVIQNIKIPEIVFPAKGGEVAAQATKELVLGIKRLCGFKPKVEKKYNVYKKAFFLNINSSLKPEGFYIKVFEEQIYITGQNENGLLYGVLRFLLLLTSDELNEKFELIDAPASSLRTIDHLDNFNAKGIEAYARHLASIGINGVSANLINEKHLKNTAKLEAIFRRFGIRILSFVEN